MQRLALVVATKVVERTSDFAAKSLVEASKEGLLRQIHGLNQVGRGGILLRIECLLGFHFS